MAKRIKRFFVFLFFSLFFSLLSGKVNAPSDKKTGIKSSNSLSWNSAEAAKQCSPKTKSCQDESGNMYCC